MIEIKRMTRAQLPLLDTLENKHLSSETVVIRLTRQGLALDFKPGRAADWQPPLPAFTAHADGKNLLDDADGAVYFAWDGALLAGQIVVERGENKLARIADVRVTVSHRRKGVGRQLALAAERWAWGAALVGACATTQDNNPGACQFFLKCGYRFGGFDTLRYAGLPGRIGQIAELRECALTFYRFFT